MKGIMLASFGSTYETEGVEILKSELESEFPDFKIGTGFSPNLKKYWERKNLPVKPSYKESYDNLSEECDEVFILSVFMTAGVEFNKAKLTGAKLTAPLLTDRDYYSEILKNIDIKTAEDEAVLLVGHGTAHDADNEYQVFYDSIPEKDVYFMTIEGKKVFDDVKEDLKKYKSVRLIPLFLVAGEHVNNDIFGEENSIAWELRDRGIKVTGEIKGLLESEGIRKIFIDKMKKLSEE